VAIFGTVVTSAIAMLVGVPVSFGIAVFITELAPRWLKRPVGMAVELLAAVPSIIYGMWGLFVFAPLFGKHIQPWMSLHLGALPLLGALFQGPPMGIGLLTAGLILSIMVIPFISAIMRDVFEAVPPVLKEAAYGMGATTWEVVTRIVLPYSRVGVVGGVMLGLGRALGETMAVAMVLSPAVVISFVLTGPQNPSTIASNIALNYPEAHGVGVNILIGTGLVLFVITFVVNFIARWVVSRRAEFSGAN
jgi:phosphate transport system permease protein